MDRWIAGQLRLPRRRIAPQLGLPHEPAAGAVPAVEGESATSRVLVHTYYYLGLILFEISHCHMHTRLFITAIDRDVDAQQFAQRLDEWYHDEDRVIVDFE